MAVAFLFSASVFPSHWLLFQITTLLSAWRGGLLNIMDEFAGQGAGSN
jgi:hypothetical protein